jgi:hypothetical protein
MCSVCVCVCVCVCVYIYMCVCVYIYVCMCMRISTVGIAKHSAHPPYWYITKVVRPLSLALARGVFFSLPPPPLEHHADLSVIRLSHSLSLARGGGGLTLLPHVEQRRALVHFKTLCLSLCLSVSRASVCRCAPSRWERERAGLQSIYSPSHTLRREEDSSTSDFSLSARIRFTWRQCENTTSHVMLCNVCYVWRPCENIT